MHAELTANLRRLDMSTSPGGARRSLELRRRYRPSRRLRASSVQVPRDTVSTIDPACTQTSVMESPRGKMKVLAMETDAPGARQGLQITLIRTSTVSSKKAWAADRIAVWFAEQLALERPG